jgi:hypothetical protein
MMIWKKERPLIGTEGFIKGLHSSSSTDGYFIQSLSQVTDDSQLDSFIQVGVPIRAIVEDLLAQGRNLNDC